MIANQRALLLLTLLSIFSGNNLQNLQIALIYIIIYIFKTRVLNINYDQIPNSNRERKNCFQSTAIQNLSPKCFLAKNIGARFTISSSSPLTRL